jgi:hypothetical protein
MRRLKLGCIAMASCELVFAASCDCGPRIRDDDDVVDSAVSDESTSTGDASQTASSVGSGSTHEPIDCPDGEVQCGDECADLRWSNDHCGACDHACMHHGVGECWEGVCPPTEYCARFEDGHATCDEVCAAYGQPCVDSEPTVPASCGGEIYTLYYVLGEDFDCHVGFWASAIVMGGCSEPIKWDYEAGPNGGSPPGAVSCCCTQS